MTFDFRRRTRDPMANELRPSESASQEEFDAWYEHHSTAILAAGESDGSLDVPNSLGRFFIGVLAAARAIRILERRNCCLPPPATECKHLRRSAAGKVSAIKLESQEGWFITGAEATFLADHLDSFLRAEPTVVLEELDIEAYQANPSAEEVPIIERTYELRLDSRDVEFVQALEEFVAFLRGSASYGFELW